MRDSFIVLFVIYWPDCRSTSVTVRGSIVSVLLAMDLTAGVWGFVVQFISVVSNGPDCRSVRVKVRVSIVSVLLSVYLNVGVWGWEFVVQLYLCCYQWTWLQMCEGESVWFNCICVINGPDCWSMSVTVRGSLVSVLLSMDQSAGVWGWRFVVHLYLCCYQWTRVQVCEGEGSWFNCICVVINGPECRSVRVRVHGSIVSVLLSMDLTANVWGWEFVVQLYLCCHLLTLMQVWECKFHCSCIFIYWPGCRCVNAICTLPQFTQLWVGEENQSKQEHFVKKKFAMLYRF